MCRAGARLLWLCLQPAAAAAMEGACDIYAARTHSTVHALYTHHEGALYTLSRADNATQQIGVVGDDFDDEDDDGGEYLDDSEDEEDVFGA